MTSDDITDFIATMPDVLSNWAIIVDHLKDAADEIDRLNSKASNLESALAQPDMLAEAVKLLRAVRRGCNCGYDYLCSACQAAINASRFVSRYDAAQQE